MQKMSAEALFKWPKQMTRHYAFAKAHRLDLERSDLREELETAPAEDRKAIRLQIKMLTCEIGRLDKFLKGKNNLA